MADLMQNCRNRLLEMFRRVEAKDPYWKPKCQTSYQHWLSGQRVVALVSLNKIWHPYPSLSAIYFIQPTEEKAFLFFSSRLSKELWNRIKSCATLKDRLGACAEMNLEFLVVDNLGFITNNEGALAELYENEEDTHKGTVCLKEMAARISICALPRAAESLNATTITTFRDLIPTKLAAEVFDCLMKYKNSNPDFFPRTEICDLLILDRSIDQITPVMHEWTYDAMCHDLLVKRYVHEWTYDAMSVFMQRNFVSLVQIAGELNKIIKKFGLRELGRLEQDLVFGDAGIDDVIKYLESKDDTTREHKLRLLMILPAIYPEVFEGEMGYNLMKLAKVQASDINAVNNTRLLAGHSSDSQKSETSSTFSKSRIHEKNRAVRKKGATEEEETWQLPHFYPIIEELVEKLSKGLRNIVKANCRRKIIRVYIGRFQGVKTAFYLASAGLAAVAISQRPRVY
ncbi:hypothetical protein TIFTF001_013307 [Ficus carica]|uniref:Uncharacterized protein n=1 Tax=Ficus carica TaxID=3494 RepID=A0AA88A1R3_FICCA|nr:hypothetical protein TIFTF001_013307 [Ficus carica]